MTVSVLLAILKLCVEKTYIIESDSSNVTIRGEL